MKNNEENGWHCLCGEWNSNDQEFCGGCEKTKKESEEIEISSSPTKKPKRMVPY